MELQQQTSLSKKRLNLRDRKIKSIGKLENQNGHLLENDDQSQSDNASHDTDLNKEGNTQIQHQQLQRPTRNKAPLDYKKMYNYDIYSDDEDFVPKNHKRAKKRDIKSKLKNKKGRFSNYENIGANSGTKKNENRKVLDGVSIFDLIIPWKENQVNPQNQIKEQPKKSTQTSLSSFLTKNKGDTANKQEHLNGNHQGVDKTKNGQVDLIAKGLAQVIHPKEGIVKTNFDNYAKNVEAILINPCWVTQKDKKGKVKGVTMDEFQQLNFSKNLMIDGLIFVWVEKEIISPVIKYFESQGLIYVENVCWVMLDQTKKEQVEATQSIDVSPAYIRDDYQYIRKSHKTLLMFRRLQKKNGNPLELRHQRTCDVCFDFVDTNVHNYKPNEYLYKLIETLLPQSIVDEEKKHLRMIELWAQDPKPRKGWIKFIEQ